MSCGRDQSGIGHGCDRGSWLRSGPLPLPDIYDAPAKEVAAPRAARGTPCTDAGLSPQLLAILLAVVGRRTSRSALLMAPACPHPKFRPHMIAARQPSLAWVYCRHRSHPPK